MGDQLNKMKAKVAKDCGQIANEIADVRAATDEVARSKASAEKSQRALTGTLNELTKKIEEVNLNLGDFEAGKRRITAENADLLRQLNKALGDADMWKQKYEIDGIAKAEELEMARLKMQARLSESQAMIE